MKPPMHPAWSWFFLALVPFAAAGLAPRALAAEPDADAAPAATTPPRITAVPSAIDLVVNTVDGYVDIDVDNLPALPAASFVTSAVEQPEVFFEALPVDTTPDTPYDDLSQVRYHAMVQSLTTPFVRHDFDFIVRAAQAGTSIRVYAGPDVDGDGMPDASEERCRVAALVVRGATGVGRRVGCPRRGGDGAGRLRAGLCAGGAAVCERPRTRRCR